jgi:hypothetical protein
LRNSLLSKELRGAVTSVPEPAESFGLDEFVRRAAEREHVDRDTAYDNLRAVLPALAQVVAPGSSGTWRLSARRIINPC